MNRKTIFALAVVGLVVLSGTATALGGWMNETETVGIVDNAHAGDTIREEAALAGTVDAHVGGVQVVQLGQADQISHPGAEVAYRLSTRAGESNVTLIGEDVGVQYDYYSDLKEGGSDVYDVVRGVQEPNLQTLSRKLVEKHWTSASTAVVANPNYVRDFVGGAAYAQTNGLPILYEANDGTAALNETLQDLGVSTVYVTANIDPSVRDALGDTYTINELPTDNGETFVNSLATGTGTLYLVPNIQSAPYALPAAGSMDVMVVENRTAPGADVMDVLQANNPDVVLVGNQNEMSAALESSVAEATSGDVTRVGSASPSGEMARLALYENGLTTQPLVTVTDVTTYQANGSQTIEVTIRNVGFADAQNVVVSVNRTEGASYTYLTQPEQTDGPIVWKDSLLAANGTMTIQYSVTGVSGTIPVPHVESYENVVGSQFQGMTILTDNPIYDRVEGLYAYIAGIAASFSPIIIAGMVAIAALLGIGILYFENRGDT